MRGWNEGTLMYGCGGTKQKYTKQGEMIEEEEGLRIVDGKESSKRKMCRAEKTNLDETNQYPTRAEKKALVLDVLKDFV